MDYNIRYEFSNISDKASNEINAIIEAELHEIVPRYKKIIAEICEGRTDKPFNFIDTLVDQHIYTDTKAYLRKYSRTLTSVLFDVANYMSSVAEQSPQELKIACEDCIQNITDINQINKYHIYQRIPIFLKPFLRRVIDTYKSVLNSEEEKELSDKLYVLIKKSLEKDITDMIERIRKKINKVISKLEKDITKISDLLYDKNSKKNERLLKDYNSKLNIIGYSLDETYNGLIISEPTGKKHRTYIDGNQLKTSDNSLTISIDKDLIVLYNSSNYYKFITVNDKSISIRNNETTISIGKEENLPMTWNRTPIISLAQKYYVLMHIGDFFPTIIDLLLKNPSYYQYFKKCKKTYESNKMLTSKGINSKREKEITRRLELLGYTLEKKRNSLKVIDSKEKEHNLLIRGDYLIFEDNDSIRINLQAIGLNNKIEYEYIFMDAFKHVLISNASLEQFDLVFDSDNKIYRILIDDEMIIGYIIYMNNSYERNDGIVLKVFNDFYPNIVKALYKRVDEIKDSIPLDIQIKRLEQTQDVQQYLALINKKLKEEAEEEEKTSKS